MKYSEDISESGQAVEFISASMQESSAALTELNEMSSRNVNNNTSDSLKRAENGLQIAKKNRERIRGITQRQYRS